MKEELKKEEIKKEEKPKKEKVKKLKELDYSMLITILVLVSLRINCSSVLQVHIMHLI